MVSVEKTTPPGCKLSSQGRLVVYTVLTILADLARPPLAGIVLVVRGSEAQSSGYLTTELSQGMSY